MYQNYSIAPVNGQNYGTGYGSNQSSFAPHDVSGTSSRADLFANYLKNPLQADEAVNWLSNNTDLLYGVSDDGDIILSQLVGTKNWTLLLKLLEPKFDLYVNFQNSKGNTPLHRAAYDAPVGVVKVLLDRGADPNIYNKNNRTPGHNAAFKARDDILQLMDQYGLDRTMQTRKGRTVDQEYTEKTGRQPSPVGGTSPSSRMGGIMPSSNVGGMMQQQPQIPSSNVGGMMQPTQPQQQPQSGGSPQAPASNSLESRLARIEQQQNSIESKLDQILARLSS